jgi:hypothetical protein
MSRDSKIQCKPTLEEEYKYEHLARIKAQNYIDEHKVEKRMPVNRKLELDIKLEKMYRERQKSVNNMDKIIKRVFK